MDGGPWKPLTWNYINIKIGETMHFSGGMGNTTDVRREASGEISILDSSGTWRNCGMLIVR